METIPRIVLPSTYIRPPGKILVSIDGRVGTYGYQLETYKESIASFPIPRDWEGRLPTDLTIYVGRRRKAFKYTTTVREEEAAKYVPGPWYINPG